MRWFVVATAASVAHSMFAPAAFAAERLIGDRPVRTLAAVHATASVTMPRSTNASRGGSLAAVSHGSMASTPAAGLTPSPTIAVATASVSPLVQLITGGFNSARIAAARAQGNLLGWAIASRKEQLVDWMLYARLNPNARDSSGLTPLLHAAIAENWSLAARLLAQGAEPDAAGPQQVTPLMIAASAGHVDTIQTLVQSGATVDASDAKGHRPLHYALATRKRGALEALLAADARVTDPDVFPLAAETRDWSFIGPVLERFDSRAWDLHARVLLEQTIRMKQVDQLRLLLAKHKGPATLEGAKDPLLAYAVVRNDLELARLLLQAGADPNITLPAKPEDRLLNLVPYKTLKHYLTYEPGMNLMTVAAGMGHAEMIRLLLAHGAERNRATKSKHRLVPLYFAAWGNHVEALQTLIGNAPKPDQMRIEISLTSQEATLYKNGVPVFRTEISSGQSETPTPTGQYVVTDKKRHHVSNLYDAKMPFFMRLSCKDFGMHEGHLPGYPASHGCIRLPGDSARKLFREVPIGTLVTIR